MALPVLPSNGFITRLLQQTTQTPTVNAQKSSEKAAEKADQTSISNEARQANNAVDNNPQLESKLIELYNQKGQGQS